MFRVFIVLEFMLLSEYNGRVYVKVFGYELILMGIVKKCMLLRWVFLIVIFVNRMFIGFLLNIMIIICELFGEFIVFIVWCRFLIVMWRGRVCGVCEIWWELLCGFWCLKL